MNTYVGYDCVGPNGKTRYTHTTLKNNFTETRFLMVALDLVTKKTGKGKKYKPKIGKVPDVYANGTLGGR